MGRPIHRHRHIRLETLRQRLKQNRIDNAPRKKAERQRREARMLAVIKAAQSPDFHPAVRSWISERLGKPWRQVTPEDIKALTA